MRQQADALVFVEEAIDAISLQMTLSTANGQSIDLTGPEHTIALELESIRHQLNSADGAAVLFQMAERVRQCAIALYAARETLACTETA